MRKNIFKDSKRWMTMALASAMVFTTAANNGIIAQAAKASNAKAVKKVTVKIGKKNVTKKKVTLVKGKSANLKVAVSPSSAKKSISYKTSAKKYVTVNKKGKITAKKAGKAKITVTVKGKNNKSKSTYINVVVKNATTKKNTATVNTTPTQNVAKLTKISVTSDLKTIEAKGQTQVRVSSATPGVALASVTYKSGNPAVLTVDEKGKVTGIAAGESTVIVTAKDANGNEVTESIAITVKEAAKNNTLKLNNTVIVLPENGTKTIIAMAGDETSSKKVVWKSNDESVVSVTAGDNNTGIIKGLKVGKTTVEASIEGTNITQTCEVTVTNVSDALRITGANQTEYNKVQLTFNRAVTADEQKKLTFLLNDTEVNETEWAADGMSVVVNNSSQITAGANKISVKAEKDDVSIDDKNAEATFTATQREVKKIEFVNSYLPIAQDETDAQIDSKTVRVRFNAIDDKGSKYEGVDSSKYTFSVQTLKGTFSISSNEIDRTEKDAISFAIPKVAAAGDQIKITVSDDKGVAVGTAIYTLDYISVDKVEIKGIKNNEQLYQDDTKDQEKVLDCVCYNNKGEVIDLLDGNYNKINVNVVNPDSQIYIDSINVKTKEIKVIVKKGAYTEKNKPVSLQIANTDGVSTYRLEVRQKAVVNKINLASDKAEVIAQDSYEPARIAFSAYDQYGEAMSYEQLSIEEIKKTFGILGGQEVNTKWDESALSVVEDNGVTYLQISGEPLRKTTNDPKETASVNVAFIGTAVDNQNQRSSINVTVKDARKASKFVLDKNAVISTSLYQNESVTYNYEVQDQYGKVYETTTGEYAKLAEVKNNISNLSVTFDTANKTVTIKASENAPKNDKYSVQFGVKNNDDTSSYLTRDFSIKENFAGLKVSYADSKKKEYTAGETIKLKVEAVDKDGKLITSYNASNIAPFNTQQDGVDNIPADNGISFENGVAYVNVKASKATDAAFFSFATALPGRGTTTYGTKETDAKNSIKIKVGEAAKFGISYNNKVATIAIQDSEGNNVTSTTTSTISLTVKVNGVQVGNKVLTFGTDGTAKYTFTDAVASGATISVVDKDGKLKGEYVVAK